MIEISVGHQFHEKGKREPLWEIMEIIIDENDCRKKTYVSKHTDTGEVRRFQPDEMGSIVITTSLNFKIYDDNWDDWKADRALEDDMYNRKRLPPDEWSYQ